MELLFVGSLPGQPDDEWVGLGLQDAAYHSRESNDLRSCLTGHRSEPSQEVELGLLDQCGGAECVCMDMATSSSSILLESSCICDQGAQLGEPVQVSASPGALLSSVASSITFHLRCYSLETLVVWSAPMGGPGCAVSRQRREDRPPYLLDPPCCRAYRGHRCPPRSYWSCLFPGP